MIRNIIFDLGNVLLTWKPEEYLINNGYSEEERKLILDDVFRSSEWLALDNGDLTVGEAVERISARSSLKRGEIYAVFDLRTKILSPIARNTKMVPALKKAGFRVFYLSNFPADIFDEVVARYDFFEHFDGGFISAHARSSKPEEKIFRLLLETYSLKPEESLFIDDTHINAVSAGNIGISVIHLRDPRDLKTEIENLLGLKIEV